MDENADDDSAARGAATGGTGTGTGPDPRDAGRNTFFGWMRGMRLVRQNGWIGGVCGGVAARLGIDPLIVRGIAVVVALFGGPVFLLYAAAWLLLPDAYDRIHLEQLLRGVFEPAIVAIGVVFLFTFLPVTQGFWWTGARFWGGPHWGDSLGHVLWSALVIAAIVALIVWAVRRSQRPGTPRPGTYGSGIGDWRVPGSASYAGTADGTVGSDGMPGAGGSAAGFAGGPASAAGEASGGVPGRVPGTVGYAADGTTASVSAPPVAPAGPGAGADAAAYEAWRVRQQQWRQDYAAWREQNDAAVRAQRENRAAAMRAEAHRLALEAEAARRARRVTKPRTSFVFIVITLGVALLAAGVFGAMATSIPSWQGFAVPIALSVATLAVGLAMMVAGAMRRRSGFLAFVAIVLAAVTLGTALTPRDTTLFSIGSVAYRGTADARVFQPAGSYAVDLDGSDTAAAHGGTPITIEVNQWVGQVWVSSSDPKLHVRVLLDSPRTTMTAFADDGSGSTASVPTSTVVRGDGSAWQRVDLGPSGGVPDVIVRVHQGTGSVQAIAATEPATTTHKGAKK